MWTGGKPKADWSGLEEPNPKTIQPNRCRTTSVTSQSKSLRYRTQGLETKLTRDSDFQIFQKKFMKRLVACGMDTIAYVVDPSDALKVMSVVTNHAKHDLTAGVKIANDTALVHFNKYDFANTVDARELLFESLGEELETQLCENCDEEDSFAACWFHLVNIISSVSVERFEKIKTTIKDRNCKEYPGENVESMATDYLKDWKELHGASMCDHEEPEETPKKAKKKRKRSL